ncbi:MAG: hypothetical protein AAGD25_23655 [Cyanobacteria bacterium P01_F01_bin.150]
MVILEGPSNNDKATLLTLIGTLRAVQAGNLRVLNQELNGASKRQLLHTRSQIGLIFQSHH